MWQSEVAARAMAEANPGIEAVVFDDAGHLFSEDIEKAIGRSWEYMMGGTIEGKVGEARIGRDPLRPARARARLAGWWSTPSISKLRRRGCRLLGTNGAP